MNFEQLEYIVRVASEKSISRAAEKLHISPSGVSQSITQLEKELNTKIFNRSRAGVSLTPEGQIVLEKSLDILNNLKQLKEELISYQKSCKNHLKLTCAPTFTYVLHDVFKTFTIENKDVTFELEEQNSTSLLKNFTKDAYDLAYLPRTKLELEKESNLQYEFLHKGYICIVVGKNSPLYSLERVTANELYNQKVVMYSISPKNVNELVKKYKNNIILRSNRTLTLFEMIKGSQIITYVHDITLKDFPEVLNGELKVIPIKDSDYVYVDFWAIYPATAILSNVAKEFIEAVKFQLNKDH